MTSHFQTTTPGGVSQPSSPARTPRVYASVAEMKRSKGKSSTRVRFFGGGSELHRDFHSTPDLAQNVSLTNGIGTGTIECRVPKAHRSQEDVATLLLLGAGVVTGRPPLPPPTHPPPPPPIMGQLTLGTSEHREGKDPTTPVLQVKVDVSRNSLKPNSGAEYVNMGSGVKPDLLPSRSTNGDAVMSSFRPANSAKLYASPEDVKTVGYRSRSLPAHSNRPQVRKSHSLRSSASSFKPGSGTNGNSNPYAQPFRASRSHSTAGSKESLKSKPAKKSAGTIPSSASAANLSGAPPPPIPEPDYSLSESEGEGEADESEGEPVENKATVTRPETSGSSSGSSSSTLPHSFSVEEIQKVRTQLKSSKSYPNDFLMMNPTPGGGGEDGDNSSSGVSSDQDVPVGPPSGFDDGRSSEGSGGSAAEERGSSLPPPSGRQRPPTSGGGVLTRNAVSLAQLPPPMEGDGEGEGELVVPPPPEFLGGVGSGAVAGSGTEEVLAPPPQFCDNRLVTRVRIVGAVPKSSSNTSGGGRLHSQ